MFVSPPLGFAAFYRIFREALEYCTALQPPTNAYHRTMPLLFSYGTLQEEKVQVSTFGRRLDGQRDELPGFELTSVRIEDPQVVAETGMTHYANVKFSGRSDARVRGTLFEISEADLAAADEYEQPAGYKRITAMLASGMRAWVYLHDCFEP